MGRRLQLQYSSLNSTSSLIRSHDAETSTSQLVYVPHELIHEHGSARRGVHECDVPTCLIDEIGIVKDLSSKTCHRSRVRTSRRRRRFGRRHRSNSSRRMSVGPRAVRRSFPYTYIKKTLKMQRPALRARLPRVERPFVHLTQRVPQRVGAARLAERAVHPRRARARLVLRASLGA